MLKEKISEHDLSFLDPYINVAELLNIIPIPFTIIDNPQVTHMIKLGNGEELPVYNNYFTLPIKGYFLPIYSLFFREKTMLVDPEVDSYMRGVYQRFVSHINYKAMPKIKNIVIFKDVTTREGFNILVWGNLLTKTPTSVMTSAIKKWETLSKYWNLVRKDYPYLMKLGAHAIYPLRENLSMIQPEGYVNLFLQTKRDKPPVIRVPNYPLDLPFIIPERVRHNPSGRTYLDFEAQALLIESNDVKYIKEYITSTNNSYSSAVQLHDKLVYATVNPYMMEVKLITLDGQELVLKRVHGNYYTKPTPIHKLVSGEIWSAVKKAIKTGDYYTGSPYYSIHKVGNYYYPLLHAQLITVNSRGWVLLELGYNEYDEGDKRKFIVTPADTLDTVKIVSKNKLVNGYYTEKYPVIKLGKMTILIDDPNTSLMSYKLIGQFFRKTKKKK